MLRLTDLYVVTAVFLSFGPQQTISAAAQCFFPDGFTTTPDVPCNQSAVDAGGHSPCCNEYNMCLDNGLCFAGGVVSRGSCTDSTWGDDCPQYCKANPGGGNPMYPCFPATSTWACGFNNSDCLDPSQTFTMKGANGFILRGNQVALIENGAEVALLIEPTTTLQPIVVNNSSSASQTSQPPHTVTVSVTNTPNPSSQGKRFSAGIVAGAVACTGAPLLLALAAAGFFIFRLRKNLQRERDERQKLTDGLLARPLVQQQPAPAYNQPLFAPAPGYLASPVRSGAPFGQFQWHNVSPTSSPVQNGAAREVPGEYPPMRELEGLDMQVSEMESAKVE